MFLKDVVLAPFAVLIMTWCKQLLLIGLFLMSLFFPFSNMKDVSTLYSLGFESLWGSVSWQWLQKLRCLQAMWLKRSGWQYIRSRKKSHCSNGDGREPGCFDIVYSQMCSTHKKVLWNLCLLALKHISGFWSDSRTHKHKHWFQFFGCVYILNSGSSCTGSSELHFCWGGMLKTWGPTWEADVYHYVSWSARNVL